MTLIIIDYKYPISFTAGTAFQEMLVGEKLNGCEDDYLLLLSHNPVVTVGAGSKKEHIVASELLLHREGIDIQHADRGGDVTYHGPGQLVGYPIINLNRFRVDPGWYIRSLEEVLERTILYFGLEGSSEPGFPGVWVGNDKIAAIGVSIRKGIAYHGFALNIEPNMRHFSYIVPCGLSDRGVTSMHSLLGSGCPSIETVKLVLTKSFLDIFNMEPRIELQCSLPKPVA